MITKLPRWVWTGACALAAVAGFVNVIGFLGFEHQAVTHLTGTTTMLAASLAEPNWPLALHFFATIVAFVLGTILSGFVIQDSTLRLNRRYGIALLIEGALLFGAAPLLMAGSEWGLYCASCACGLQNAMTTTYSGTVVRTSHVSGMITDLGIALGHALRGLPFDARRVKLCVLVISGFLCGGIGGAVSFRWIGYAALQIPATCITLTAAIYWLYTSRAGKAPA